MPFEYVTVAEAMQRGGLRMVVVGGVPSPWGEAAKGLLHLKRIPWVAVRVDYQSEALKEWVGQRSGPVAVYEQERPRAGWAEILLLAERLAPAPSLVPADPAARALAFGLSHELCGEGGLGWSRRLQLIHRGLSGGGGGGGGFPVPVGKYLGKKYGYSPEAGGAAGARVASLLRMFAARLAAQRAAGSRYYVGDALSMADIYSATCMAMFRPLPHAQCAMDPITRAVFDQLDEETSAALEPILLEHRDMMYAEHLEQPLSL